MTVTPLFSSEDGLQMRAEWRQRFENGRLYLDGSIVNADRTTSTGEVKQDEWRGHLFGKGRFDLDDTWRTGFDVEKTSDRTYLRRYRISGEDILTSRAFVEGFKGRNYAVANAYQFDDLRDNAEPEPFVIPWPKRNCSASPTRCWVAAGRWTWGWSASSGPKGRIPSALRSRRAGSGNS